MTRQQRFQKTYKSCLESILSNDLIAVTGNSGHRAYVNGATRKRVRQLARQSARRYMREGVA